MLASIRTGIDVEVTEMKDFETFAAWFFWGWQGIGFGLREEFGKIERGSWGERACREKVLAEKLITHENLVIFLLFFFKK